MLEEYDVGGFFDEMMQGADTPRAHFARLYRRLAQFSADELAARQRLADLSFFREGITFTVYGDQQGTERTMPFDFVPRIIPNHEWGQIEAGLIQRVRALNLFLDDVYHQQEILRDAIVPRGLVVANAHFYPQAANITSPHGVHIFLAGIDLIRDAKGQYHILEDNLRNPSGLSYVMRNRHIMRRVFPELFYGYAVRSLQHQFEHLISALRHLAPHPKADPNVVLLTPGIFNSAYFDHSFLAQQMGIELVEGRDMVVMDRKVFMKTTTGLQQVDVIYRRIDDNFLDPLEFRPDSQLGVPGLMDAYRAGHVSIVNAVGNGVADNKAVYAYVPDMIRYYLGEEPLLPNVETYILSDSEHLRYALEHLQEMVVKPTDGAGGYDIYVGPQSTAAETEAFRQKIRSRPEGYIAQPAIALSRIPTFRSREFKGCHVDLRPYVIFGEEPRVIPGGLTRVALRDGSLIVNSSQGGGGKDTWVLEDWKEAPASC